MPKLLTTFLAAVLGGVVVAVVLLLTDVAGGGGDTTTVVEQSGTFANPAKNAMTPRDIYKRDAKVMSALLGTPQKSQLAAR